MSIRKHIQLIESYSSNKNYELLTYLSSDDEQFYVIWPVFVRWLVYETDGEGVSIIEQITGNYYSHEEFEDEYEAIIQLSPSGVLPRIPTSLMSDFKKEHEDTIKEIGRLSNTKLAFDLLDERLLPEDTVLIHYTDEPEKVYNQGFVRGMPHISMLGETVRNGLSDAVGYNFAYRKDDTEHNLQNSQFRRKGYVIFKSSGVYVYHYGDHDKQVIFWGGYVGRTDMLEYGYV